MPDITFTQPSYPSDLLFLEELWLRTNNKGEGQFHNLRLMPSPRECEMLVQSGIFETYSCGEEYQLTSGALKWLRNPAKQKFLARINTWGLTPTISHRLIGCDDD